MRRIPAAVFVVTLATCLTVGVLRYLTYHAWAFDLGYFTQVVDRTAAGHPFATTFAPYNFLGQHWEPGLIVLAPAALVVSTPLLLIVVQSIALAAAPVAAWRLARVWVGGDVVPAAACIATAVSPLLASAAAYDFHTESVTPALALFSLDAAARGRTRAFLLLAGALLLVKEDAMLVAAGVGWIAWRATGRREGLAVAAAGVVAFAVAVAVVMPAFRGGQPGDLAARYAYLGATPLAAAASLVSHPLDVITHLTGSAARLGWLRALGPLAFLPILAGAPLLGVLPVLGVALLSDNGNQASLDLQYGLEAFPLLVACAIIGIRRLGTIVDTVRGASRVRMVPVAAGALVVAALATYVLSARLPGGRAFDVASVSGLDRRDAVEAVLARVPDGKPVSASSGLVAHLADREQVNEYPMRPTGAYVVLDSQVWGAGDPRSDAGPDPRLRLAATGYHVVCSGGGVTLWAR